MSHLTIPTEDLRAATRALKSAKATRSLVGSMRVLADDDGIRKQTERHATQLALMVVWAGSALRDSPLAGWVAMFGECVGSEVDALSNACDLTALGPYISEKGIARRLPSCPSCAVLLDQAHEVAP